MNHNKKIEKFKKKRKKLLEKDPLNIISQKYAYYQACILMYEHLDRIQNQKI